MNHSVIFSAGLLAFVLITACIKTAEHTPYEAILMGCRDSVDTKLVDDKLIGKWKLEASGCGFCPTAGKIFSATENVKLLFMSDSNVVIYRDETAIDTASFILKKYSPSGYYLDQGQVKFNHFIGGGMFFCGEILGFDSRAGDGAIYLYHKLK